MILTFHVSPLERRDYVESIVYKPIKYKKNWEVQSRRNNTDNSSFPFDGLVSGMPEFPIV